MLRKLIFPSKSGTEMRPTNDHHQSRHTETATIPSGRPESSPSVPWDSKTSIPSSPLALHIVHQPDKLSGDIVLVHGFGASPYQTWTWNQDDQDSFWPAWLPDCDPTLAAFRISTFGYNAKRKGSVTSLDIVDCAKDLLFALRAAFDSQGQSQSQPVILIAHSLGGLVVKKAYTLGNHDEQYKDIAQRVRGMIFLATPHRGSQYAKMLKNILSTGPAGSCSRDCIATLALQTSTIQDINESFLIHCKDIKLCSLFGTFKTHLTVRKIWVHGPPIALTNTNTPSAENKVHQDNQRFHDVRASSCNVWKPDVENSFNYSGSFTPSTEPVIADLSSESSKVTAIYISPDPVFFARGRSDGSVSIGFEFHDSTNVNDGMCSLVDFGTWTVEAT
ncbi:hypothetical protein MY1884_002125 [Beauveria asiatica]